jgi:hypothetical protein
LQKPVYLPASQDVTGSPEAIRDALTRSCKLLNPVSVDPHSPIQVRCARYGIFSAKIPNLLDFMLEDVGLLFPVRRQNLWVADAGRHLKIVHQPSVHWKRSIPQKPIPAPVCFYIPVQGLSRPRRLCQTLHGLPLRIGTAIARKEANQRQESALPRTRARQRNLLPVRASL